MYRTELKMFSYLVTTHRFSRGGADLLSCRGLKSKCFHDLAQPGGYTVAGQVLIDPGAKKKRRGLTRSVAGICLAADFECGYTALPPVHEVFQTFSIIAMLRIIVGIDQNPTGN
jgi:hypothetical protein